MLERLADGTPSFLAVLGVSFTPPNQLSFGFSLDRVDGIVGVHRTVDVDALAQAVRTGAAGNARFAAAPPLSPLTRFSFTNARVRAHSGSGSTKASWTDDGISLVGKMQENGWHFGLFRLRSTKWLGWLAEGEGFELSVRLLGAGNAVAISNKPEARVRAALWPDPTDHIVGSRWPAGCQKHGGVPG